jgi:hypothetical protein
MARTSPTKKKLSKERAVVENESSNSRDAQFHYLARVLQSYGELASSVFAPMILREHYPDGFGHNKASPVEYGIFLFMAAHLNTPLTEAQIRDRQLFIQSSSLGKLLTKMVETGYLKRQGLNYSLNLTAKDDYQAVYESLLRAIPAIEQLDNASRNFVKEFERRNGIGIGNGNGNGNGNENENSNGNGRRKKEK